MIKLLSAFRWIINPLFSLKLFNNKHNLKFVKKIYSFFFTRKGVKNAQKFIAEIDEKLKPILSKYNGYLGCGNCLFLARNQDSFGSNDIDYCVQGVNNDNVEEFIVDVEQQGFKLFNVLYKDNEIIELKFKYKKTYFDVFVLQKIDNKFVISKTILLHNKFPKIKKHNKHVLLTNCCVVEQKWTYVSKTIQKEMNGHLYDIPANYEDYLLYQYGEDWRTPIKDFDFLTLPKNNPPTLAIDQGIIEYIDSKDISNRLNKEH